MRQIRAAVQAKPTKRRFIVLSPGNKDARLQYCGLFQQSTRGESLDTELFSINEIRMSFEDNIGGHPAGRGGVHDAVAAETVNEVKAFDARRGPYDRVMVGRHFVKSRPRAARINSRFCQHRHA